MRIRHGQTRSVLLIGGVAIKIGRVRPIRFGLRMLIFPFSQSQREHFYKKYGAPFWKAALHDIFAGWYANQREYQHWSQTQDPRVMPTRQLLGDWIVAQPRGKPLQQTGLASTTAVSTKPVVAEVEQLCEYLGQVVLVDYASPRMLQALAR